MGGPRLRIPDVSRTLVHRNLSALTLCRELRYMYDMLLPNVSGWRQKENVMQHIFPTTPVEIGPGFIVGKERIVTKARESFSFPGGAKRLRVRYFDRAGWLQSTVAVAVPRVTAEVDGGGPRSFAVIDPEPRLHAKTDEDQVRFEAHGDDAILVTIAPAGASMTPPALYPSALVDPPASASEPTPPRGDFVHGNLRVKMESGLLVFERVSDNVELLREAVQRTFENTTVEGYYAVDLSLQAYDDEALYGLGQHKTGALDNKGQSFQLAPENTEVLIPVVHSSRGYSFLWNMPSKRVDVNL